MSIRKSQKSRVRRSPEAARENILAAAESLLVEQGPQALKLADVANAAGVANATVLHHFGSIDGVQAALMEHMIAQLVENIIAAHESSGDLESARDAGQQALFDAFEKRGAARLAAWLELTGEARRLTIVRSAVEQVQARMRRVGLSAAKAEDLILVSVVLAIGVGLFGRSLSTLIGKPPGRARKLASDMLQAHTYALVEAL